MKFIKKFREIYENEDNEIIPFFIYSTCDSGYGYLVWEITEDADDVFPDDGPCRYSTDGFIISEDDENREKEKEILAKQTGGEYDEDYDYDYDEEEYVEWSEELIWDEIYKYHGTDLWGKVYVCFGKKGTQLDDLSAERQPDGSYKMKSQEEFEKKVLSNDPEILGWMEVEDYEEREYITDLMVPAFVKAYEEDPTKAGEIYLGLKNRNKEIIKDHFEEIGEIEFLETLSSSKFFGLF
jgi:hypothetical protein